MRDCGTSQILFLLTEKGTNTKNDPKTLKAREQG